MATLALFALPLAFGAALAPTRLGTATLAVLGKTGTLTEGAPRLVAIRPCPTRTPTRCSRSPRPPRRPASTR
ncbi:MAG: hypothetical protein ACRDRG_09710 [Pseudonocardiaceae bacterium]